MDYKMAGERIRLLRRGQGMTQRELAARCGISTSFMGHVERGTRKASMETYMAIAHALSIGIEQIFVEHSEEDVLKRVSCMLEEVLRIMKNPNDTK